jgi:hypothetical protein
VVVVGRGRGVRVDGSAAALEIVVPGMVSGDSAFFSGSFLATRVWMSRSETPRSMEALTRLEAFLVLEPPHDAGGQARLATNAEGERTAMSSRPRVS